MLIHGDSLVELVKLADNSVDLIVTDPPYGYSFMGKEWDKALPDKRIWKECLRVLKHGGFAYIMSAPRQDVLARMMIDLEDSGFNTDFTSMYWAYATGFPKAMNVGKAVDKKLGVEREVIGTGKSGETRQVYNAAEHPESFGGKYDITKPATDKAKELNGSYAGFQPKPAVEVIIVCMKPLSEKGYVDQAMKDGKGVSWFDDCRIPTGDSDKYDLEKRGVSKAHGIQKDESFLDEIHDHDIKHGIVEKGRFPANLLVSDNAVDNGIITKSPSGTTKRNPRKAQVFTGDNCGFKSENLTESGKGDSGSFSRYYDIDKWYESQFIISPKASKSEKNKGCEDFEEKFQANAEFRPNHLEDAKNGSSGKPHGRYTATKNNHPTVKPLKLMSYLITLGSREGDVVLDPFMGSGTTPLAAKNMKRKYIGIEREEEYFKICCARVGDEPTIVPEDEENDWSQNPERQVPPVETLIEKESTICNICGVNYSGLTLTEHQNRDFHKRFL